MGCWWEKVVETGMPEEADCGWGLFDDGVCE